MWVQRSSEKLTVARRSTRTAISHKGTIGATAGAIRFATGASPCL